MAMMGYSALPRSPELELYHQMKFSVILRTLFHLSNTSTIIEDIDNSRPKTCEYIFNPETQHLFTINVRIYF